MFVLNEQCSSSRMAFVSTDFPHPPWSSLRDKGPARTPLSRDAIVDAAMAIVDAEGLDGLSMRRLAERLGTGPASLYAHVSGKPELLQLLIDRVAGETPPIEPDAERWEEQIKEYLRAMHKALVAHRDLAGASLANIPTGPNAIASIEVMLGILRTSGLPDKVVALAADLLPQYITADAYEGSLFAQRMEREPQYFEALFAYFRAIPADRFPNFAALADAMMAEDEEHEARFEFGLDVLVRGLASIADQAKRTE
jgi:AcrR family transcriptional regulator